MNSSQSSKRSRSARGLGILASALAVAGFSLVAMSLGAGTVFAGDPPPLPRPEITPTEPPPVVTQVPPTPEPTFVPEITVQTATPTRTPTATPTRTPTPVATPAVVAGVSALPRTGDSDSGGSVNFGLLFLGATLLAGAAGAAGLTWKASRAR